MFRRDRWKRFALLAVILVSVMILCLWANKPHERTAFVGNADQAGYRCRFKFSADWTLEDRHLDPVYQWSGYLDMATFTSPTPHPYRKWVVSHLMHRPSENPPRIILSTLSVDNFGPGIQFQQGYPEWLLPGQVRLLAHRHILIDGCRTTVVTVESRSGKPYRNVLMLVCGPNESNVYVMGSGADPGDFAMVDREMKAIIASFHLEKVPSGGKR